MRKNNTASASAASYVDIMEKTIWKFHGMIMRMLTAMLSSVRLD